MVTGLNPALLCHWIEANVKEEYSNDKIQVHIFLIAALVEKMSIIGPPLKVLIASVCVLVSQWLQEVWLLR